MSTGASRKFAAVSGLAAALAWPGFAHAAALDGSQLSVAWGLPFAGLLLSIALCPLLAPGFWHHHHGKIAAAWGLAFLLPFALTHGGGAASQEVAHALFAEYIPFIVLLTALFTVAGGLYVGGNFHGSPGFNCGLIAVGAVLASLMGTTGASMLLIRPLIRANDNRRHNAHVIVFFIFVVSNAGGSLTPLGDPPLFLGFLKGVDFFWTVQHILPHTLFLCASLLALLYLIDRWYFKHEDLRAVDPTPEREEGFHILGTPNLGLLLVIVALVLMSGLWKTGISWQIAGVDLGLPQLVRDVALIGVCLASLLLTPKAVRAANQFEWGPMQEVAKLFAGIFITIIPVLAMLKAGDKGAFAGVVQLVSSPQGEPLPGMYFWASGLLSSFLDNAPTYLAFFNLASGDAQVLMGPLASVLAAISAGSVFMGANSYIGNAPNLMVKAIAESRGVRMPSFFGYMVWSFGILLPLFAVITLIWF